MQNELNASNIQPSQGLMLNMNHGGHEIFDTHEILAGLINVLDLYQVLDQHIKDPALKANLHHQYTYILDVYNISVEAFTTGKDPSHSSPPYKMNQSNEVIYGLTPSQPKKPNQSVNDMNEQGVSGHMLGLIKSTGSLLAMSAAEITNPVLRRVVADSVPNFIEMAYEIFLYQNKNRFYQVPQLTQKDMTQMIQSYAPSLNSHMN